eukprot:4026696-Pyramimonas_sp.AAC.1
MRPWGNGPAVIARVGVWPRSDFGMSWSPWFQYIWCQARVRLEEMSSVVSVRGSSRRDGWACALDQ